MNKLAEYAVTAGSLRRRSIIADAMVENACKRVTYEHGRRNMVRFFSNPSLSPIQLLRMAEDLRAKGAALPDEDVLGKRSFRCSAQALETFEDYAAILRDRRGLAVPAGRGPADLTWSGVQVSVRPDISFLKPGGTEHRIGALKFHFSVKYRLSPKALKYAATILHAFLQDQGEMPKRSLCVAVDVMAGEYESAPMGTKSIIKELQASCRDIALLWPSIVEDETAKAELKHKVRFV